MANIAGLLSSRGKKVLAVDFDLEAPGLWRYFSKFREGLQEQEGLIDLLLAASSAEGPSNVDWRDYVTEVPIQGSSLALMTSGRSGDQYPSRVLSLDWATFFRDFKGGEFIENMRSQWRREYDFTFIDSRTGITDAGGICTILLPDLIVPVFVSNWQSLEGVVDVITRAQAGRNELAYDRPPAAILPILSRFDSRTEWESAQEWLDIAADRLKPFYADWLPRRFSPRIALERTKLPYVAYFSFGETLPALAQGISDPDSLGYALNTISQLIEGELGNAESVIGGSGAALGVTTAGAVGLAGTGVVADPDSSGSGSSPRSGRGTKLAIGLWGAPQSGKTTFLAALYIAINRSELELNLFGTNDESTEFLVEATSTLTRDRRFPAATLAVSSYSWTFNMSTQVQIPGRGLFGRRNSKTANVPAQFEIDLRDTPGGHFGSSSISPPSRLDLGERNSPTGKGLIEAPGGDGMLDYLAESEGLLLLVDPIREREHGDAHEYFQGTLLRIAQRRMAAMPPGSKLPHYVAVCITKFDDPEVYRFARLNGYRSYNEADPYMFPRVHDDDAESFFREFCNSDMSDADLVTNALSKFFHPERIRYFVTSAIGFYRKSERFREDDHVNVVKQDDGTFKIRGQIHPINVVEPVLWLGQSVALGR